MIQLMNPGWLIPLLLLTAPPVVAEKRPDVRDGDLVFVESTSAQSELVRIATESRWTHMGVVFVEDGEAWVLEAVQPVKKTKLASWSGRGTKDRLVVKRLKNAEDVLTPEVIERMEQLGTKWLGLNYDGRFLWDDDRLYCSELAYKLFDRGANVQIGQIQKAGNLQIAHPKVQAEIQRRFKGKKFDAEEPVVTPQSMYDDPQLVIVFER